MSELFKALQKLEEQNAPEVPQIPQAFSPSSGDKKPKNSLPYLKSALLCVLLLVLTVVCLGFIWFARDDYTSSPTVTTNDNAIEKEQNIPAIKPMSVKPEKNILPPTTLLPKPEQIIVQEPIPAAEKPLTVKQESTDQNDTKVENSVSITQKELNPEIQIQQVDLEQFIKSSISDAEREQSRDRQRKRILYQAEKMREQGDLPKALTLYKKAWSFGPNPDIANNLAAILIQSRQYKKAEDYLQQVISLAPDDEDLRFNLEIAQEGRKRKKMLLDEQ